jgi:hypothetical protein
MLRLMMPLLLSVFLFTAITPATASAQDKKRIAYTDINEVDEDFAFQGEYLGTAIDGGYWQYTGLQVVAGGDGEFDAVQYRGGLPGYGWNGSETVSYHGRRQGRVLTLEAWPIVITIYDNGVARIRNESEEYDLGQLTKVHRVSPTLGQPAPPWAKVLFDGTSTEHFKNAQMTEDGLLKMGTETKQPYRDYRMHIEFRLPYMPHARGQGRGNSGVYLQSSYEVQILDSFGLKGEFNECGSLYRQRAPDVNMCFPPLTWQTYDIDFRSPRFDEDGNKIANARLTVYHNGVPIHNDVEIPTKTGAGAAESPTLRPTKLQNHRDPVVFRNIWLIEYSEPSVTPPGNSQVAWAPACQPQPFVCFQRQVKRRARCYSTFRPFRRCR